MYLKKMKKKYKKYKSGKFFPKNGDKYKGTIPIIYRSSWELKVFRWCDTHPKCIKWGSESTIIPYNFNGKQHRYYIDLTAIFKTSNDETQKWYIEIKPYKQTILPVKSVRKKEKTYLEECLMYAKNTAKWIAAKKWCPSHGGKFIILTERDLFK